MAIWYVDTTEDGADDGTSKGDAWENARSAYEYGSYTAGDVVYFRRNQTSTLTDSNVALGDAGTLAAPILMIGDNETLDIWSGDSGDVRHILDFDTNSRYFDAGTTDDYFVHKNLHYKGSAGDRLFQVTGEGHKFENCILEGNHSVGCLYFATNAFWAYVIDCTFTCGGGDGIRWNPNPAGLCYIKGTTINGAAYGLKLQQSGVFAENLTILNSGTADIRLENYGTVLLGRNVKLQSGTEISWAPSQTSPRRARFAIEDYDGTKGEWYARSSHVINESIAASSTGAGAKRSGGADRVVKSIAQASVSDEWPVLIHEQPRYIAATGTKTVDVYIQPEGWASVPDTQGADADVWVEIAAWDTGNSEYLYFDSRDKATQSTQVNDTWNKIVTENVVVDAIGWIIVRVFQIRADGIDIVDVGTIVDVA